MRGWKIFFVIAAILLLLSAGIFSYYALDFLSAPPSARIHEIQGVVAVKNAGSDWAPASVGLELSQGAEVRTGDGTATILLFGGSILRLDKNSSVELESLKSDEIEVKIVQKSGRTWNRVVRAGNSDALEKLSKITGIKKYELRTPSAVATVRGTSFSADLDAISVVVGAVAVKTLSDEKVVSGETASIVNNSISVSPLIENEWIKNNVDSDKYFDEQILERIKTKYSALVKLAKDKYGLSDEEIDSIILEYIKKGGGPVNLSIDGQLVQGSLDQK